MLRSFLAILPVFGLWMLPLGLILLSEDLPIVRRRDARARLAGAPPAATVRGGPRLIDFTGFLTHL
jgi:hypothetical protein